MTCVLDIRGVRTHHRSGSSGRSADAATVEKHVRDAREHLSIPVARLYIELDESLNAIKELTELEEDWNLEGGRAVDPATAESASELVRLVYHAARLETIIWESPAVGPLHDGGLSLEWDRGGRRAVIFLRPGQPDQAECILREAGASPVRAIGSTASEAVNCALWALSAA